MRLLDYDVAAPEGAVSVSGGYSIKGYKGGGKGGGGSTRTPTEDQDNLHSIAYASVIDLISAGPVHGFVDQQNPLRSVYLDNTPIQNEDGSLNFQDVQLEFRAGTQDQRYIPGFPAAESTSAVNVELRSDQPFTRAIQNVHISGVRVGLSVRGLKQQSTSSGDITGYRVEYVIEMSTDGSAFVEVLRHAFDGKTTQQYSRSHRIDLPRSNAGWSIRVRRLTPNASNSTVSDVTYVDSITEVTDAKLRRPMSACVGIRVNAKQFQSIPSRAYHMYLRVVRVPSNYDAWTRSYVGTWDGTFKMSWTDNPAWVFYDLATNACDGLGRLLPAGWVDRWALYNVARYCDELVPDGKGGTEPRFACNVYIQTAADAWKVLQDLASVFRGLAYYAHGTVLAVADMPRDAVYTYTNANVIEGKFNYAGSGLKTRYTVALVSWNDETDMGRAKVEVVEDQEGIARYGVRQVELTAFGCTSQGQAQRLGRSALFTSRMETESVTFGVGLSGTIAQPGQVIEIADGHLAGRRIGGLVKSATASAVTLDAPARVSAGDRLTVVLPSGVSQSRSVTTVQGPNGLGETLFVNPPFSQAPQAEAAWSISSPDLATQKYRVLTVSEGNGLQHTITALQYVDGKHAAIDYETRVEVPPISVVPPPVQSLPTNVLITSYHVIEQGQARHNAVISWEAAPNAVEYEVQWRRDNSEWISAPRTGSTSIEIPNIYAGGYVARVRAINVLDVSSLWVTTTLTQLSGDVSAPRPVTHLIATPINWGIRLNWGFPTGPNIFERTEIRYGVSSEFAQSLPAGGFAYPTNQFEQAGLAVTTEHFYWARLIDKNGTPGPWYPTESQPGVRGKPSQDAEGYNELVNKEIVEGALGQLIMGNIRDIPNIRDTAGTALAETERLQVDLSEIGGDVGVLSAHVERIDFDLTKLGADVNEIQIDVSELEQQMALTAAQVDELLGAAEWDSKQAYAVGTVVFSDGKMYRAKKAVPAGTPVSNTAHWDLIGDYASISDGLIALAIQAQETLNRVEQAEGQISAVSAKTDTLATKIDDPENGLTALSLSVHQLRTQANQLQDGLSTLSEATIQLSSKVEGLEGAQDALSTAVQQLTTRAERTESEQRASAQQITSLSASIRAAVDDEQALLEAALAAAQADINAQDGIKAAENRDLAAARASQALEQEVSQVDGEVKAVGRAVTVLEGEVRDAQRGIAGQAAAHQELKQEVTQIGDSVSAQSSDITQLKAGVTAAQNAADGAQQTADQKADATALDATNVRVESVEGGLLAEGQKVSRLESNLTTTNQNVAAAKQAADAAQGDATQALHGLDSKADALAVQLLTTRTEQVENGLSSQGSALTGLENAVNDPNTGLAATAQAVDLIGNEVTQTQNEQRATNSQVTSLTANIRASADDEQALLEAALAAAQADINAQDGLKEAENRDLAAARATQALEQEVSQIDGEVKAVGRSVTVLQGEITDAQRGINAQASAHQELKQEVTQLGDDVSANSSDITQLKTVVNDPVTGLAATAGGVDSLNVWAGVKDNQLVAQAQLIQNLTADIGTTQASVQTVSQAQNELDGRISASYAVKTAVNVDGVRYVTGFGLDTTTEGGVTQTTFAVIANRFAVMHDVNGTPQTVFSVQGGAAIFNAALIAQAAIKSAQIESLDARKIETPHLAAVLANIDTAYIKTQHVEEGAIKRLHVGVAEIDTLRVAGNAITVVAYHLSPAVNSYHSTYRDTTLSVWLPIASVLVIQSNIGEMPPEMASGGANYSMYNDTTGALLDQYNFSARDGHLQRVLEATIHVAAGNNTIRVRQPRIGVDVTKLSLRLEAFMR